MRGLVYLLILLFVLQICLCNADSSSDSSEESPRRGSRNRGGGGGRRNGQVNGNRRGNANRNRNPRIRGNGGNRNQQGEDTDITNQQAGRNQQGGRNVNQQQQTNSNKQDGRNVQTGGRNKENGGNGSKNTINSNGNKGKNGGKNGKGTAKTNQNEDREEQDNGEQEQEKEEENPSTPETNGETKVTEREEDSRGSTTTQPVTESVPLEQGGEGEEEETEMEENVNNNKGDPCDLECKNVTNPRRRVCGSDGVTYDSFCFLKAARCENANIEFDSRGECHGPLPPTVQADTTPNRLESSVSTRAPSSPPVQSVSGEFTPTGSATPDKDRTTPDSRSTVTPAESSTSPVGIVINVEEGMTSPQDGGSTPRNIIVPITDAGETTSVVVECPEICPLLREEVCGSDGVTYQSPCVLQLEACVKNDRDLIVASLGSCPLPTSPLPAPPLP